MSITVEVSTEAQAELARQAAAQGRAVEVHAASLLEEAVDLASARMAQEARSRRQRPAGRVSLAELFARSPFKGLDLDFERDRDLGRNVEL